MVFGKNEMKKKILRVTTVASTMNVILKGQLAYLSKSYEVIGATAIFDNYFEEIKEREGIKLYPILFERKINPIKDLISIFQLCKIIKNEKPDIIHSQTPKAGLVSMIAGFIMRVPIRMHSVVGTPIIDRKKFKGRLLEQIDKLTYLLATNVYPNSYGLLSYLLENKLSKKNKLSVIGAGSSNGIDLNWYCSKMVPSELTDNLRLDLKIPKNNFVFGFVGRLVNDKGIRELVDAFLKLMDDKDINLHITLMIVGPHRKTDDPLNDQYYNILTNHKNIKYVGLQKDVRPFLKLLDCFVFPSYREGMPGSLMQAFAFGIPSIGTEIIGSKELLGNDRGLLVPSKDFESLYLAMKKILTDSALRISFSENCKLFITENFQQQKFWEKLELEYTKLLDLN